MGNARARGSFEERRGAAITAGRIKGTQHQSALGSASTQLHAPGVVPSKRITRAPRRRERVQSPTDTARIMGALDRADARKRNSERRRVARRVQRAIRAEAATTPPEGLRAKVIERLKAEGLVEV